MCRRLTVLHIDWRLGGATFLPFDTAPLQIFKTPIYTYCLIVSDFENIYRIKTILAMWDFLGYKQEVLGQPPSKLNLTGSHPKYSEKNLFPV